MNHDLLGAIAGTLGLISIIPYLASIRAGHTKPSRATYAIWSLVNLVGLISYFSAGATSTLGLTAAFTASSLLIFALSLRSGVSGHTTTDLTCLAIALVAVSGWVLTDDPRIALAGAVLASLLGYLPTLAKLRVYPGTENQLSWILAATASSLNVLAVDQPHNPAILIPPLASATANLIVVAVILHGHRRRGGH